MRPPRCPFKRKPAVKASPTKRIWLSAPESSTERALFADAARAEAEDCAAVPDDKPRTLGVLAVSTTALWFKAGDYLAAELFAHRALTNGSLPLFARKQLRELLLAIWGAKGSRDAGHSDASGQTLMLHGNLRALDLDEASLRLGVDGAPVRILGMGDSVDGTVGAMVNHDVDVRVVKGDEGDLRFVDIARAHPGSLE